MKVYHRRIYAIYLKVQENLFLLLFEGKYLKSYDIPNTQNKDKN